MEYMFASNGDGKVKIYKEVSNLQPAKYPCGRKKKKKTPLYMKYRIRR